MRNFNRMLLDNDLLEQEEQVNPFNNTPLNNENSTEQDSNDFDDELYSLAEEKKVSEEEKEAEELEKIRQENQLKKQAQSDNSLKTESPDLTQQKYLDFLEKQKQTKQDLPNIVETIKNEGKTPENLNRLKESLSILRGGLSNFKGQKEKEEQFFKSISNPELANQERKQQEFETFKENYLNLNPFKSKEQKEIDATNAALEQMELFNKNRLGLKNEDQSELLERQRQIDETNLKLKQQGLPLLPDVISKTQQTPEIISDKPYSSLPEKEKPQTEEDFLQKVRSDILPYRNVVEDFQKEQAQKKSQPGQIEPSRGPAQETEIKKPTPKQIIDKIISVMDKYGYTSPEDKAFKIAQIYHESGFDPNSVSSTGKSGLGQMGLSAFIDAKKVDYDNSLGGIDGKLILKNGWKPYLKELNDEWLQYKKNWETQIVSSVLYDKKIDKSYNKTGTRSERLLKYHGGPKGTPESIKAQSGDDHERMVQDIEQIKNGLLAVMGDEEKTNAYINSLTKRRPAAIAEEPSGAAKSVASYLSAGPEVTNLEGKGPLMGGPYKDTPEGRALYAKLQYESKALKEAKDLGAKPEQIIGTQEVPTSEAEGEKPKITSDFVNELAKIAKDESGLSMQVLNALRAKNENIANANLLRAVNMITSSLAGMKSKVVAKDETAKYFEDLVKSAGEPVEDLKTRLAFDKEDPNSPSAKAYRSYLESLMDVAGLDKDKINLDGMTPNQMEKVASTLGTLGYQLGSAKEKAALKKEERSIKLDEKTKEQKVKNIEFITDRKEKPDFIKTENQYRNSKAITERIDQALKDPSGIKDITVLYDFIKQLDKESTVREGETKLALAAAGYFDKFDITLSKMRGSGRLLSAEMVKDIKKFAELAKQKTQDQYFDKVKQIRSLTQQRINASGVNLNADELLKDTFTDYDKVMQTNLSPNDRLENGIKNIMEQMGVSREEAINIISRDPQLASAVSKLIKNK